MQKTGRNDPCPCGSGKKYKKCCELKDSTPKKFHAEVIPSVQPQQASQGMSKVSSLFFRKAIPTPDISTESVEISPQNTQDP